MEPIILLLTSIVAFLLFLLRIFLIIKFLLKIANDFKSIKKELKTFKTNNNKVKNAITTQIKLCEVYEQIEDEIKTNGVKSARKHLKNAEKYYQEFIKILDN